MAGVRIPSGLPICLTIFLSDFGQLCLQLSDGFNEDLLLADGPLHMSMQPIGMRTIENVIFHGLLTHTGSCRLGIGLLCIRLVLSPFTVCGRSHSYSILTMNTKRVGDYRVLSPSRINLLL